MFPPTGFPDAGMLPQAVHATADVNTDIFKPPLPTSPARISKFDKETEVRLPPLIAGSFVAAFARALAQGLDNALLTHYYLPDRKVKVNLDRVLDRLLANFCREIWDELYQFYHNSQAEPSAQVVRLFEGPISQLILILNGPESSRCVLDIIAPGLSQRPLTWSEKANGIELQLALQLVCGFWHREFPDQSPGGCPEQIARTLHSLILNGQAAKTLVSEIRRVFLSPDYVQVHIAESTIWEIIRKRRFRPPMDGFQLVQFKIPCQLFGQLDAIADPNQIDLGSLPAITGTPADCIYTTLAQYTDSQWPKCGRIFLKCLQEAVISAALSSKQGDPCPGMSVWDSSDEDGTLCPGLRLIHLEVEENSIRISASAWTHTLIEIFQQICWTVATLSKSPIPDTLSACTVDVSDWAYVDGSVYVDCTIAHEVIVDHENKPWMEPFRGSAIAGGFPLEGFTSLANSTL